MKAIFYSTTITSLDEAKQHVDHIRSTLLDEVVDSGMCNNLPPKAHQQFLAALDHLSLSARHLALAQLEEA